MSRTKPLRWRRTESLYGNDRWELQRDGVEYAVVKPLITGEYAWWAYVGYVNCHCAGYVTSNEAMKAAAKWVREKLAEVKQNTNNEPGET